MGTEKMEAYCSILSRVGTTRIYAGGEWDCPLAETGSLQIGSSHAARFCVPRKLSRM